LVLRSLDLASLGMPACLRILEASVVEVGATAHGAAVEVVRQP
jgi:hypothetical protein